MQPQATVAPEGKALSFDGIAVVRRGDTLIVCIQRPARLERVRWLYDVIDAALLRNPDGLLGWLIILSSADPPDAATRRENSVRLRKLGNGVRRLVTTPIGNAFWFNVVRSVMRGINVLQGNSGSRYVTDSLEAGLSSILAAAGPKTPSAAQLVADLAAVYQALGEPQPTLRFPAT
jgi:hypothetical protein